MEGQHSTEVQSPMRSLLLVRVGAPQKMDHDSSSPHRVYVFFIIIIIIIIINACSVMHWGYCNWNMKYLQLSDTAAHCD